MLDLDNEKWKFLNGGYRTWYDASVLLKELEANPDAYRVKVIMEEFWQELHHQGDVDLASYFSLPHLIRIGIKNKIKGCDIPALVATIEIQRHSNNPAIPPEYLAVYKQEIKKVTQLINQTQEEEWGRTYATAATAAIAAVNGQIELAKVILEMNDSEISKDLDFLMENYDEIKDFMERNNPN